MPFTWIIIFTIFGFLFCCYCISCCKKNGRIIIVNPPNNDSTVNAEEENEYSPV